MTDTPRRLYWWWGFFCLAKLQHAVRGSTKRGCFAVREATASYASVKLIHVPLVQFEKGKASDDVTLMRFTDQIATSANKRQTRKQNLPRPEYPSELPVVEQRDEILAAIKAHQVIILCGETGSGKTTQLPKICLEAGRGVAGLIGHTQPRRIAARSVAARIASELNTTIGEVVGFKIRFSDQVGQGTYIKLMTDGILLAEIQNDPWLNQYDTLIIDEAHERSLNIDFLLGYLKNLLARRPDLKLIITSATIERHPGVPEW